MEMNRAARTLRAAAMAAWALLAAGCSYLGNATSFDPKELDETDGWHAVRGTPVLLQRGETDCGPAAVGMIFGYWQIPVTDEELKEAFPTASTIGAKAREIRDLARKKGLQCYLFHGQWEDLDREIGKGHPVVVGLVKPYISGALTHYEVVVALHPEKKTVVTLDPGHGWRQNSQDGFRTEWEPAGFLTLVFFKEESPPPSKSNP